MKLHHALRPAWLAVLAVTAAAPMAAQPDRALPPAFDSMARANLARDRAVHGGELPGYAARANGYPDARMAVVVLMNNSGDASPSALAQELAARVLPVARPAPRPFPGDAAPLAGTYRGPGRYGDLVVVVTRTAEGIAASVDGAPARPLRWVEGLAFQDGPALLAFRGANGNGAAAGLGYDTGSGYSLLRRLGTPAATLARTRLFAERRWPLVLLGLAVAASAAVWGRRRRRGEAEGAA